MSRFLLVCLGGALGSGARYLVTLATPFGTIVVNLVGSFLIAFVLELVRPSDVRLMIVTGILGGFTTYSAFNQETLSLMRSGTWAPAVLNLVGTVTGCLVAGMLGVIIARAMR